MFNVNTCVATEIDTSYKKTVNQVLPKAMAVETRGKENKPPAENEFNNVTFTFISTCLEKFIGSALGTRKLNSLRSGGTDRKYRYVSTSLS